MPRKRFADLEDGRRERILTAAAEEFAGRGYEAASVNRIIAAAGISKGSLYYYFDDKEDLFITVVEHASQQIRRETGAPELGELTAATYWIYASAKLIQTPCVCGRSRRYSVFLILT